MFVSKILYSFNAGTLPFLSFQEEMRRIEDEQTYEELKILYEIIHNKFHDLAEVRTFSIQNNIWNL